MNDEKNKAENMTKEKVAAGIRLSKRQVVFSGFGAAATATSLFSATPLLDALNRPSNLPFLYFHPFDPFFTAFSSFAPYPRVPCFREIIGGPSATFQWRNVTSTTRGPSSVASKGGSRG